MMYNEQQKLRYLKQSDMTEDSKEVFKMISNTAAKVEKKNGDLSTFTRDKVIDLLKTYNSKSRHYLRLICNHFSKYYNWCYSEGLVDKGNFNNWYDAKLSSVIIKEVLPSELLEDKYFNDETAYKYVELIKDPQNKLLFYAPYLGIDGDDHIDLRYLKIENLNEKRKAIQLHSGRIVNVDDLFISLIKDADKALRYNKNGTGQHGRGHSEYGASQYVFKVCAVTEKDVVITSKNINQRYAVIKEQTQNKLLNPALVYKNGLLNYIERHFKNKNLTLKDALFLKNKSAVRNKSEDTYIYNEEVQQLINLFGSNMEVRALRYQMTDIIHFWDDERI